MTMDTIAKYMAIGCAVGLFAVASIAYKMKLNHEKHLSAVVAASSPKVV
jgi:hypothetical protein